MGTTSSDAAGAVKISYTVKFPEAQAHYADVEMRIQNLAQNTLDIKMPVWTPGSYLIREYSKNVESFTATSNGNPLPVSKTRKNCWHIGTIGINSIIVKYRVYCFEISVRTSFVDAAHGFLSTAGIFMYPDKMLDHSSTIHIIPYNDWTNVSTSLEKVNGDTFTRYSPNYDILFDSPIEVGNQDVFGFDAAGVKYEIAMCGGGNYDKERLKKDFAKIVEQETAIYGENPNKYYVFIIHNFAKGGGGLEHLSSTVLGASRDNYSSEAGYFSFLSLVAHEHFHLWNVKRLRPIALGPFDYENENYTTDLWIAEGFTSYYQNLILRHCNLYPPEKYLNSMAGIINVIENQPGAGIQSVTEASFDAWIKAYRPNENSANSIISYYDKGAVIAMLLDLEIINNTKGKQSIDDVMRYMYDAFYKGKKRGYTDMEFKQGLEKFTIINLGDFYKKYIYGVAPIDYNKYLNYAGYKLIDEFDGSNDPTMGVALASRNGKNIVTNVSRGGAGWIDGINVNDELESINGIPVINAATMMNGQKVGDKVSVTVIRDGLPVTLAVTLLMNPKVDYKIVPSPDATAEQLQVRKKWLGL